MAVVSRRNRRARCARWLAQMRRPGRLVDALFASPRLAELPAAARGGGSGWRFGHDGGMGGWQRPPGLGAWPGLEPRERLPGGARGEVVLAARNGELFVVCRSQREPAALAWELHRDHLPRRHQPERCTEHRQHPSIVLRLPFVEHRHRATTPRREGASGGWATHT